MRGYNAREIPINESQFNYISELNTAFNLKPLDFKTLTYYHLIQANHLKSLTLLQHEELCLGYQGI